MASSLEVDLERPAEEDLPVSVGPVTAKGWCVGQSESAFCATCPSRPLVGTLSCCRDLEVELDVPGSMEGRSCEDRPPSATLCDSSRTSQSGELAP